MAQLYINTENFFDKVPYFRRSCGIEANMQTIRCRFSNKKPGPYQLIDQPIDSFVTFPPEMLRLKAFGDVIESGMPAMKITMLRQFVKNPCRELCVGEVLSHMLYIISKGFNTFPSYQDT
jgi:hypothetical protein